MENKIKEENEETEIDEDIEKEIVEDAEIE